MEVDVILSRFSTAALLAFSVIFSACGGGDSNDPPPPAASTAPPEGYWETEGGAYLITPTGELWGYQEDGGDVYLDRGVVTASGSNFTGTFTSYLGHESESGTLGGTFVPSRTVTGVAVVAGERSTFTLTFDPTYNTRATQSAVTGSYSISDGTLSVSQTGAVTGSQDGCTFSGTLTPDASGKNFYRVSVTFGASPCDLAGATATGVAVIDDGRLIVGIVSRSSGTVVVGNKIN